VSRSITVYKVRALRTSAALRLRQVDPFTVQVAGRVKAASKPRGKAHLVFQKRAAKGKWGTKHRFVRRAGKRIAVTKRLTKGNWRVFLSFKPRKGFKKSRSKTVALRITGAPLVPPVPAPPAPAPPAPPA
jgi:hypothetical protein